MPVKIGYSLDEKTKTTYAFVKSASEYPDGINGVGQYGLHEGERL